MMRIEKKIDCKCGKIHTTCVRQIIIEDDAFSKVVDYIKDIFPCGHIVIMSYKDIEYYSNIALSLRQAGFRVSYIIYDAYTRPTIANAVKFIDDNTRLIIGIGSGALNSIVKYVSTIKKIPNVFLATAPSTDSYLNKEVYMDDNCLEHYIGIPPTIFIADTSIDYPRDLIAAGIASLYLRLMSVYDYIYEYKVGCNTSLCDMVYEIRDEIISFFKCKFVIEDKKDIHRLMTCLANVSLKLSYLQENAPISTPDILARLLRQHNPRQYSISLVSAHLINNIYRYWLTNDMCDIGIPPDRVAYYEQLDSLFNINKIDTIQKIKMYDECEYSRIEYASNSMKKELHQELMAMTDNPSQLAQGIRKLYRDRGYHISEIIDYRHLIRLAMLSSEISPNMSLMKFIDKTGLLWQYVNTG